MPKEYPPRKPSMEYDGICECGHYWFYHESTLSQLLDNITGKHKHGGRCEECMCPIMKFERYSE